MDDPGFESWQVHSLPPERPGRLWGPRSLLFSVSWGYFQGQDGRGLKLTTHFPVVLRLRVSGPIPLLPLLALMTQTRTTVPFFVPCNSPRHFPARPSRFFFVPVCYSLKLIERHPVSNGSIHTLQISQ
jgi:hypothetical protein